MVYPQGALIAKLAMFAPWGHNLLTHFAVGELADFGQRNVHSLAAGRAALGFKVGRGVQLQELHVCLDAVVELVDRAIRSPRDMLRNRRVHALEQVLTLVDLAWDGFNFLKLLRQK